MMVFMKKRLLLRITAVLLMLCTVVTLALAAGAAYPKHSGYVYDGAGVLASSVLQSIRSTNDTLYGKVKARIAVCVVESLGEVSIEDYAAGIFNEWNPGECVLLIVTVGEKDYYAVQSVRVASILDNERLDSVMKSFMEPDFAAGDVGRAIQKTVNKLTEIMKMELLSATTEDTGEGEEKTEVTFGSVMLSVLSIIGWTALILVVAFAAFFIAALFNDTAAELMNRYVFSRFNGNRSAARREDYYDERLYGKPRPKNQPQQTRNQQRPNPQRPTPPQANERQNGVYDRYRQGGVRYDDEYYGNTQAGTAPRRNPRSGGSSRGSQGGAVSTRQRAPRQQQTYADDGYTRQFSINDLNRSNDKF